MTAVGTSQTRVDGRAKVTGAARYTVELAPPGTLHMAIVGATIAAGRVSRIEAPPDVVVLDHTSLGKITGPPQLLPSLLGQAAPGQSFFPLQDDVVHYAGQPVALIVAETLEAAQHAAQQTNVEYERGAAITTIEQGRNGAYEPERIFGGLIPARNDRGDVDAALQRADVRVDASFHMAANHHHPLEGPATVAWWEQDRLTLIDSTMGVRATQLTVAHLLGLPLSHVRVLAGFVGGSFGMKAMVWPHVTLAAMTARLLGRPVRVNLTRPQLFTCSGHREEQEQRIALGASRSGDLTAIRHEKLSLTSPFDDWAEPATGVSSQLYGIEHYSGVHRLIRGNTMTPTFTRGPGDALGVFALESAMDELAHALGHDPVALRLRNHTATDDRGHEWSSDGLPECLRLGAAAFGWEDRNPTPRATRNGHWLLGQGMAAAGYPIAFFMPEQRARARIHADGSVVVQMAFSEFGSGALTIATQVAADALGVDLEAVTVQAADSDHPNATSAVASAGAGMISSAVHAAGTALRDQLIVLATSDPGSPLHQAADVTVDGGVLKSPTRPGHRDSYGDVLARHHLADAEATGSWRPPAFDGPYGLLTFGAQFAEVAVDPELGLVRVRRLLGAFAPGRLLNPMLARSQLMGGMLWGMSQALLEGNAMDPRTGRWAAGNLAEYLVPVNADAPDVQVEFVEVEDELVGPLGAKGVGEIGQVGVAAAIANAVFHATGRRVRELPITPQLVIDP